MTASQPRRKLWIALFSQTGSELVAISERLGRWPDAILTNNRDRDWRTNDSPFYRRNIMTDSPSEIYQTLRVYRNLFADVDIIITLHGFLRILPPDICEMFEIYNGHPGDIITYPELKGKDPQAKALELGHPTARAVIHRVTPVVDDGEIVAITPLIPITDTLQDVNVLINILKSDSVSAWVELLKDKLTIWQK